MNTDTNENADAQVDDLTVEELEGATGGGWWPPGGAPSSVSSQNTGGGFCI